MNEKKITPEEFKKLKKINDESYEKPIKDCKTDINIVRTSKNTR